MKYRIKEVLDKNGKTIYYAQDKKFLLWRTFAHMSYEGYEYPQKFTSYESALREIEYTKFIRKSNEVEKVKYIDA